MRWGRILPCALFIASAACATRATRALALADHAAAPSERCFRSKQGIDVFANDGAVCPRRAAFSRDADQVMARAGLAKGAFLGVRVVYVRGEIDCDGVQTLGCSDVDRRVSLVSLDCPWPRKLTRHELGHQAVRARGLPERRQAHEDPWWRAGVSARMR